MTNNVVSTNLARTNTETIRNLIMFLVFCFLISGCKTTEILTEAMLYECGSSTIYLSGWYKNVSDKSSIDYDPIGGYLFAYWIDDAGNVCHGDPGKNGQPGPAVLKAYKQQAFDSANNKLSITQYQLQDFQEIPYSFDHYIGSGLHFVQFYNVLARTRASGETFRFSSGVISLPNVLEVDKKSCVAPVALEPNSTIFLPSIGRDQNSQDPNKCKVRTNPVNPTMSEEERLKYNTLKLPHGSEIYDVP